MGMLFTRLFETEYVTPYPPSEIDESTALAYEMYSYLTLANAMNICIKDDNHASLDHINLSRANLCRARSTGTIFAGSRGLYELIPRAHDIYSRRLATLAEGFENPSPELEAAYDDLSYCINNWTMEQPVYTEATNLDYPAPPNALAQCQERMAAECLRHALHICVHLSRSARVRPPPSIQALIDSHVEAICYISLCLEGLPASANTLWAVIIAASCLQDEQKRKRAAEGLQRSRFKMRHLSIICEALELLWNDPDTEAYGPYGLQVVMQKHGMSICIL